MKKEGWYVRDGRSLSVAFARFDSLYYRPNDYFLHNYSIYLRERTQRADLFTLL